MSDKPDIDAIKVRLAAGVNTTEALFENVMKSIRGVGIVLPFAQAHVMAASMNDLRHPYEADIAALLAEVERLRDENAVLLSVKNVTIQTPPIPESEIIRALEMTCGQWQLEALRAKQENERLLDKIAGLEYETELAIKDKCAWLAEVERLQRERAEWRDRADALMTEQMTQMRDLTAEVEALRARLTLTPEKVEAAAKAEYEFYNPGGPEFKGCKIRCLYLGASRAALLAAGMTEEALQ